MTAIETLTALVTSPRRAFTEIEKNPRFALPMILLLVANVGVIVWFYSTIDINAFVNQTLSARGLNAAQRAQASAFMGRNFLMGSAAIGMFYYGYLAAKLNFIVIDTSRIEGDLRHVFETCRDHPDMTIVDAFRTLRAKGH